MKNMHDLIKWMRQTPTVTAYAEVRLLALSFTEPVVPFGGQIA